MGHYKHVHLRAQSDEVQVEFIKSNKSNQFALEGSYEYFAPRLIKIISTLFKNQRFSVEFAEEGDYLKSLQADYCMENAEVFGIVQDSVVLRADEFDTIELVNADTDAIDTYQVSGLNEQQRQAIQAIAQQMLLLENE